MPTETTEATRPPQNAGPTETTDQSEAVTAERAQQLVEAATLQPSDLGPEWVDASNSIEESEPDACTPDESAAVASTPFLDFSNEGEFSEEEWAAASEDPDAIEDMFRRTKSLTLKTWVFADTGAAQSFYESIATTNLAACLGESTGESVEVEEFRPFDVPADEAAVASAELSPDGEGATMAIPATRNGPTVSFLASLAFDGTADLERLSATATLLHDRLRQS